MGSSMPPSHRKLMHMAVAALGDESHGIGQAEGFKFI